MIKSPDYVKRFNSAKVRFLKGALDNFFKREFPKLIGPILRDKLTDELIKILDKMLPLKDHLKPGQIVWNAVDIRTRADSKNPKFVPVILTLISEQDIEKLTKAVPMSQIRDHAIARIEKESHSQGGLLSMRDIGLFTWRHTGCISKYRKNYEKEHGEILPNTGSLQDMGSCISHKVMILEKIVIDKKDPYTVAKETKHSMRAVDRYQKDFYRVKYCYDDGKDIDFTSRATDLNKFVVKEYFDLLKEFEKIKN
jgi:hypothetical protein